MFFWNSDRVFLIVGDTSVAFAVASKKNCKFFKLFDNADLATDFLLKNPLNENIEIIIIVDSANQSVEFANFVATSNFNFNQEIKSTIKRKISNNKLIAGHFGSYSNENYQWKSFFISAILEENLNKVISFFSNFRNPILGVYSTISQSINLYHELRKEFNPFLYEDNISHWEIFCFATSTGSIKVITFKNNVFFTVTISKFKDKEEISNKFEPLIKEEISKIDPSLSERVSVYIITAHEMKAELNNNSFGADKLIILEADEIRLKNTIRSKLVKEPFLDDIILTTTFYKKKSTPLAVHSLEKEMFIERAYRTCRKICAILFISLIAMLVNAYIKNSANKETINVALQKSSTLQKNIDLGKKNIDKLSTDIDNNQILNLYNLLFGANTSITSILLQISTLKKEGVYIHNITWNLLENANLSAQDTIEIKIDSHVKLKYGDERDFIQFNQFINDLSANLKNYKVSSARSAEKNDGNFSIENLPVRITIYGPANG